MIIHEFNHTNYIDWVQSLAKLTGATPLKNKMIFPKHVGIGYVGCEVLQDGLEIAFFDILLNDDFLHYRKKIKEEYYILRVSEIKQSGEFKVSIDTNEAHSNASALSIVGLASSLFNTKTYVSNNTHSVGVFILMSKKWLQNQLNVNVNEGDEEDALTTYVNMTIERLDHEPLDAEYKKLLSEILNVADNEDALFRKMIIQSRCIQIVERFFMHMAEKMKASLHKKKKMSSEDVNRVMQIEAYLSNDVFRTAPQINELAKLVSISETKLKHDFKKVYGIPINQYFQRMRMHTAKDVLSANKYSIKQIAQELGYSNQHNFTIAFKKEFGVLPSELVI